MEILREVKSSYYSSFKDVCLKVNEGKATLLIIYHCLIISLHHSLSHSVNASYFRSPFYRYAIKKEDSAAPSSFLKTPVFPLIYDTENHFFCI